MSLRKCIKAGKSLTCYRSQQQFVMHLLASLDFFNRFDILLPYHTLISTFIQFFPTFLHSTSRNQPAQPDYLPYISFRRISIHADVGCDK